uniref:ABC-2 type transporter transmembrane domain-containing protein n=1 Tax=Oryza rufipogon TaxID=4529 RepID=A0A0E0R579_ORYRU
MMSQPAAVPRWTPSPRRRQDDDEADRNGAAGMVSDLGASMRGTEGFPFGSGRSFQPPPFLPAAEAEQPSPEISVERNDENDRVAFVVARETSSLRRPEQGAVLAWEDLWVSTAGGSRRRVPILCGLNGYARPGEKGDILINGRRQKLAFGTSVSRSATNDLHGEISCRGTHEWIAPQAYVTQDDVLMNTLTVREAVRFGLFHGLCLLAYGKTVFFGPAADTAQFFALSGFPCPSLMNPSDHFLRTINKDFDKDIEVGLDGKTMTTTQAIDTLVNSYKSSVHLAKVMHQIEEIRANNEGQLVKKERQPTFLTQSWVLTKRSFVNMYRDLGYYWLRFAIYVALCLCVGTIYYDVGHSYGSIQARGSMLMFVAAFLTFMAIGGFPSFVEDMKIFGRERLNGHYGVASFVIANTLSSTPYLALISVVPGAIAYYLTGLQSSGEHFGYFAAVLFTTMMVVEGLMMIVASAVPDFLMGIITGAGVQGVMMLNGGFFRLPNDLPKPVWKYPMYYIAFHKYANQGFYKNEFLGLTFPKYNDQAGAGTVITGEEILTNYWQVQLGYSKWADLAILIGMVVLYRVLFFVIVKLIEKMKPMVQRLRFRSDMPSVQVTEQGFGSS